MLFGYPAHACRLLFWGHRSWANEVYSLFNFWVGETKQRSFLNNEALILLVASGHFKPVHLTKRALSYVFWAIMLEAEACCLLCKLLRFILVTVAVSLLQMQTFVKWPNPLPMGTKLMFMPGVHVSIVSGVWSSSFHYFKWRHKLSTHCCNLSTVLRRNSGKLVLWAS